jgi:hypothetical protein
LVGLQLVFYWLHMVNDPHCSPTRKEALKQAGSQLKEIMQGCSGWDALKKFPGWEPVTQSDLRLLIHVLLASIDDQLQTTDSANLMSHLFRGVKRSFVKCVDIDEESSEVEGFCEIELNAKESADGTKDLMTVGHPSSVAPFRCCFSLDCCRLKLTRGCQLPFVGCVLVRRPRRRRGARPPRRLWSPPLPPRAVASARPSPVGKQLPLSSITCTITTPHDTNS